MNFQNNPHRFPFIPINPHRFSHEFHQFSPSFPAPNPAIAAWRLHGAQSFGAVGFHGEFHVLLGDLADGSDGSG